MTKVLNSDNLSDLALWTLNGSPPAVDDQHNAGAGLSYDAVDDNNEVTAGGVITTGTTITVSGYFKTAGLGDAIGVIQSQATNFAGSRQFQIGVTSGGALDFIAYNASGTGHANMRTNDGIDYADDAWHHYLIAYSVANGIYIQIDGVEVTMVLTFTDTFTGFGGTIQKTRMGMNNGGSNKFLGELSRPRIWDTELTPAQGVTEYNNEEALKGIGGSSGGIIMPLISKIDSPTISPIF